MNKTAHSVLAAVAISCQVGACIVSPDNRVVSVGYNGALDQGELSEEERFSLLKSTMKKLQGAPHGIIQKYICIYILYIY